MENYSDFTRYLLEVEVIPEKRFRYYVRWVRKFYHFEITTPNLILHLEKFLESPSPNSPPWMVRQAEHAVRLYNIFTQRTANTKDESGTKLEHYSMTHRACMNHHETEFNIKSFQYAPG
jgi:hypothetical protein